MSSRKDNQSRKYLYNNQSSAGAVLVSIIAITDARAQFVLPLRKKTLNNFSHLFFSAMNTTQTLDRTIIQRANSRLITVVNEANQARAVRFAQKRGGVYGTSASAAMMGALAEIGLAGYQALGDGFQSSDLAVLPTLYPQGALLVTNYAQVKAELGELDPYDVIDLGRAFFNTAQSVAEALAEGQESPVRSSITPEVAWKAAQSSLTSLRDVIKIGLNTFQGGFNITKLPSLLSAFPQATVLATNAPLAVQAWEMLNLQQKGELVKVAIDIILDIISTLQTMPATA